MARFPRLQRIVGALGCLAILGGCSAANYDPTTSLGKQAILDSVALKLSNEDCTGAIAELKPVYNSVNTDNSIRMMMASAYGCAAHINLFHVMGDLVSNAGVFSGGGFWAFLASEFPSTVADSVAEGAQSAIDALESVLDPGSVVLSNQMFNITTNNPGAYDSKNRTAPSNAYLFFASMSAIGSIEARYGAPYPNGLKSKDLPWISAITMTPDGCAYASAVVNFVDSLGQLAANVPGSLSTTLTTLQTTFKTGLFDACNKGCTVAAVAGCSLAACADCPLALRDRTSCTNVVTDPSSCAAAGIVNFINSTPVAGWQTGP